MQSVSPNILERLSIDRILYAIAVLALAYILVRMSALFLETLGRRAPRSRFFFLMLAPILRFLLWLGAALIILVEILAPTRETMLAVIASIGIALGFGAQDLVKNLIGGLVILVDRPYQLGDRVKIGEAYGEIDHIGLRSTKLTTPDDTRVTIPNSEILTSQTFNANSGNLDCQVVTELILPYDANPAEVVDICYEAAYSSPFLLLSKPVVVNVADRIQDRPYMLVRVKAYVYDHRFEARMQTDITVRAKMEFLRREMLVHRA